MVAARPTLRNVVLTACLGLGAGPGCVGEIDGEAGVATAAPAADGRAGGAGAGRTPGTGAGGAPAGAGGAPAAPGARAGGAGGGPGAGGLGAIPRLGARRLSRDEYDKTMRDLLGDASRAGAKLLPEDVAAPYDNDFTTQVPSGVLVEAAETLALEAAQRLFQDPARRDAVIGCRPGAAGDLGCLRAFVTGFGRRALRRPLAPAEIEEYVRLGQGGTERAGDPWRGFELVLRALLQDPELLYRVEIGAPVPGRPGVQRLDGWHMATRLSYFLWGTTPPVSLLDAAAAGKLGTPDGVRAAAAALLADPRAADRLDRLHALWLGYSQLPHDPALTTAMRRETAALVRRTLVERRSWLDLFLAKDTFVDDRLAAHYGLPKPGAGGAAWVTYGDAGRRGLLSHGSFLSLGGGGETSPVKRGKMVRELLFCQPVPPPPPEAMVSEPPPAAGSPCKWDRYAAHRVQGGACAGCHMLMDPIGFGLERYDSAGRYRTSEPGLPQCRIAGEGELVGVGTFNGPAELGALYASREDVFGPCVASQLYQVAMGRPETDEDAPTLEEIQRRFKASQHRLADMVLEVVSLESFGYRREEE